MFSNKVVDLRTCPRYLGLARSCVNCKKYFSVCKGDSDRIIDIVRSDMQNQREKNQELIAV